MSEEKLPSPFLEGYLIGEVPAVNPKVKSGPEGRSRFPDKLGTAQRRFSSLSLDLLLAVLLLHVSPQDCL